MNLISKSKRRPVIGITTGELQNLKRPNDTWSYGQMHYYTDVIESNGGVPFLIPSTGRIETINGLYNIIDGILLAGGNDIDPELYGQNPHWAIEDISPKRDNTELHLLKRAKTDKKPLLAICRGAQLWNSLEGGLLYQHLPENISSYINHNVNKINENINPLLHDITIIENSMLGKILLKENKTTFQVNSYHHQSIKKLGRNLIVSAYAPDGVIEAIETIADGWFAIGVQWHPESMNKTCKKLFTAFIDASTL